MLPVFASARWIPTGGKADEKEGWVGGTSPSGSSSSVVPELGMRAQARAYLNVSNLIFLVISTLILHPYHSWVFRTGSINFSLFYREAHQRYWRSSSIQQGIPSKNLPDVSTR